MYALTWGVRRVRCVVQITDGLQCDTGTMSHTENYLCIDLVLGMAIELLQTEV